MIRVTLMIDGSTIEDPCIPTPGYVWFHQTSRSRKEKIMTEPTEVEEVAAEVVPGPDEALEEESPEEDASDVVGD